MKWIFKTFLLFGMGGLILSFYLPKPSPASIIPLASVIKQNLKVEIRTLGELEASHSIIIASSIKGDQGKIIDLVKDGVYVEPGQVLVKMDPTPFEEKLEKLRIQIKEQECYIETLLQALEWEKTQAEHQNRVSAFEVESAKLELDKIMYGDGPQETSRLKGAMQKAWLKYEELNAYSGDLKELEAQGFLNVNEVQQTQKKLQEEKESYETAKQQYDSYIQHVYPMQIKKAETLLKRVQAAQEEVVKAGIYSVSKAKAMLEQEKQALADCFLQLKEARKELAQTEIVAPAPGMVVLREEYRASQRRKPQVGDILVKNQPLIDLPDLSSMMIKTRVREVDLFKVEIGKKAAIEVDAYPHLSLTGTIASIGVLALSDQGRAHEEKYFEVKIALDATDPRLRPGMTTRATIHAQEAEETITIPLHAIFNDAQQTYCYVYNLQDKYEKRNIQLGISNEQWAEVKTGLSEGERVCCLNPFDSR